METQESIMQKLSQYAQTNRTALAILATWTVGVVLLILGAVTSPEKNLHEFFYLFGFIVMSFTIIAALESRIFRSSQKGLKSIMSNTNQLNRNLATLIDNNKELRDQLDEEIRNSSPQIEVKREINTPDNLLSFGKIPSVQPGKSYSGQAGRAAATAETVAASNQYLQTLLTPTLNPAKPFVDIVGSHDMVRKLSLSADVNDVLPGMSAIQTREKLDYFIIFSSAFKSGPWQYSMKSTHYNQFKQLNSELIALRKQNTITIYVDDCPESDHFTSTIKQYCDIIIKDGQHIDKPKNIHYKIPLIDTLARLTEKELGK